MTMRTKSKPRKLSSLIRSDISVDDDYEEPISAEIDPTETGWVQSKRHTVRVKKLSKSKKFAGEDSSRIDQPSETASANSPEATSTTHYSLKQSSFSQLKGRYQSPDNEKLRLKDRRTKYTLNSYLTLSLDSAEEAITFVDSHGSGITNKNVRKKGQVKSSSKNTLAMSESSTGNRSRNQFLRSASHDSTNSKESKRKSSEGDHYFYKSEELPTTHEQHLIHSPYYRALFGNTAALPEDTPPKQRVFSNDSADSIISKAPYGSPRLRTASQDSSSSNTSCSSSSSSDEEQQDRQLRRGFSSSGSLHSQGAGMRRMNSHSTSNHNLRKALYNSAVKSQPALFSSSANTTDQSQTQPPVTSEEDDSESSKEEKSNNDSITLGYITTPELQREVSEVSSIMGGSWPALPKLSVDTATGITDPQNYEKEYPVLQSPKTASQQLLESKGFSSPEKGPETSVVESVGVTPASTPVGAALHTPMLLPSSNRTEVSSISTSKLSIIDGIQQFIAMTTPIAHTKVPRSPRRFEVSSASKKRITEDSSPRNDTREVIRKVISLNEEGKETAVSPKAFASPFRKDFPESFFFSPANVVPALSSSPFTVVGSASPFSRASSQERLAQWSDYREMQTPAASSSVAAVSRRQSSQETSDYLMGSLDSIESITSPLQTASLDEESSNHSMLMSKSYSRSQEEEEEKKQPAEGIIGEEVESELCLIQANQTKEAEEAATLATPISSGPLRGIRQRSPLFHRAAESGESPIPPPVPLTRQPSLNDTSRLIVDKVKISRFIYTKLISSAIPVAPPSAQSPVPRIRRWDDPDSEDEEEEEGAATGGLQCYEQLQELIQEYSPLPLTSEILEEKKQKKFFLFEQQLYHAPPSSSSAQMTKREVQRRKQQLKASGLAFEDIDFLWFHRLIANYLQEENVCYFEILTKASQTSASAAVSAASSPQRSSRKTPSGLAEEEGEEEVSPLENLNENLHKICQYLLSSRFYYFLLSQLPFEDSRFQSKIFEFCKILYVQIHRNDMKVFETDAVSSQQEKQLKLRYLKNLVDRNPPATTATATGEEEGPSQTYACASYDSCDSMLSYTSAEGAPVFREIPLLLLEAFLAVCQERSQRCLASSQQSYEQEIDVNFIAQKGFLTLPPPVSSPSASFAGLSLTEHVQTSLTTHYSLQATIQAKEERAPFRINDSDYYLLDFLRYLLTYEFDYLVHRLYEGIFDMSLVVKNLMTLKYLALSLFELMKSYGMRLGAVSELVEHSGHLQQLLDLLDGLLLFYQMILLEIDCVENLLVVGEAAAESMDRYVVVLLQKVYVLLSSTQQVSVHNSNNLYYLALHFLHRQWRIEASSASGRKNNYAQEILWIKALELVLRYLPPERLLFPNVSVYDPSPASPVINSSGMLPPCLLNQTSQTVSQKLLYLLRLLFQKLLSSLTDHHHFKVLQTILGFFSSHQSLFLFQYGFSLDFSFYLEEMKEDLPSSERKLQETQQFNQENEGRLQRLVERLRKLRQDYWHPVVKATANQLLDLIFYQMQQMDPVEEEEE